MKGFEGGVTAGEGGRTIEEMKGNQLRKGLGKKEEGAGIGVSAGGGGREWGVAASCAGGAETEVHQFASIVKLNITFFA